MHNLQIFIKILPYKKGIEKSLWVKKFIKKIEYSRDKIAVTAYYRVNPGEEIPTNDASGWVRAATGRDKNSDPNKEISTSFGRENSFKCSEWLPE